MTDPGAVVFDYSTWATRFPEFSETVSPALAQLYFNDAGLYLDNTANSLVPDETATGKRAMILNLITAHLAFLGSGVNGNAAQGGIVGRISSATEGSNSVSFDLGNMGAAGSAAAFFLQSRYGQLAYQAMAVYRTGGRYKPGNRPDLGVIPRGYGYVGRGYGYGYGGF